jgi:hypothetical protein
MMGAAMPTTFYDRDRAFEAKFAHDEEFRFLVAARRDKLFARWAANELRLSHEDSEALVKAVLSISNRPGHDKAVLHHIANLLRDRETWSEPRLAEVLSQCQQEARAQLTDALPGRSDAS